ncbi:MAG: nitroreductase family protein [Promethearchaeota archaeon]
MPVIGIDYEKCTNCQICLNACSSRIKCFRFESEQNKVIFDDPQNLCDSCGRCIGRCPADAILYENMGEILSFKGVQDPRTLIPYETLHKFMISKRSIRRFKNKKIPRDIMEKVLNSMKYAPTGANVRTLRCTIISDDNKIKKLSKAVTDAIIDSNTPGYSEALKKVKQQDIDMIFYNAPHIMIIHSNNPGDAMNATIGLTYGMLSAQSLGLGSCWIGLAHGVLKSNKDIRLKIAGIRGEVWGVIILGYPHNSQKYYRVPPRPNLKTKGLEELI